MIRAFMLTANIVPICEIPVQVGQDQVCHDLLVTDGSTICLQIRLSKIDMLQL